MTTIGIYLHSDPARLHATLESLARHTPDARIILLPDAPEPAMQATLATLSHYPQLASAEPRGQPAAFNRLITLDEAPLVVFLESGVLVTAQWLDRMRAALEALPQVGLVGPSTNCAWNAQCQRDAPGFHASPEQINVFATHLASRYGDRTATLAPLYSLADFCYVAKREVIAAIGGADEGYGLGPCWEMDYNIRAARAGFKGVWVCGAYVHRMPLLPRRVQQEARLLEANKRRYQDKFCRLQLEHKRREYCRHCEGDACENFAPQELMQIRLPLAKGSAQTPNIPQAILCPQPPEPRPPFSSAPHQNTIARTAHLPLVSCIMPTHNRRPFVAQAIVYFLRQDYPNRELIIVDDGTDPVADLIPDDPRIRYLHQEHNSMLGAKRNVACQEARGEIIAHWDDDDWMASWRLRYQVETLLQERADICGLDKLFFYDPASHQAWQYVYPNGSRLWLAGGTLCYTKACWRGNPFPHVNVGEDARFVWGTHAQKLVVLRNSSFYVAVVHPGNTSPKRTQGAWWHVFPSAEIQDLLGEDWTFYVA